MKKILKVLLIILLIGTSIGILIVGKGYTNVQNDSQKRDKDLRCKILYLFYISHDLRLKPSGLHFLVIGDRQLLKLAD